MALRTLVASGPPADPTQKPAAPQKFPLCAGMFVTAAFLFKRKQRTSNPDNQPLGGGVNQGTVPCPGAERLPP